MSLGVARAWNVPSFRDVRSWQNGSMASYSVNKRAVARARQLIDAHQYVVKSDWGEVSRTLRRKTPSSRNTRGRNTAIGTWVSPRAPTTTPKPGTPSCTETSAVSIGWASSRVSFARRSGSTRILSSLPTNSCNCSIERRLSAGQYRDGGRGATRSSSALITP